MAPFWVVVVFLSILCNHQMSQFDIKSGYGKRLTRGSLGNMVAYYVVNAYQYPMLAQTSIKNINLFFKVPTNQ